jgi:site-specific DNA-methyltransferase (adenine-specific)
MKAMPDKCVDLVLTDPPYGIKYVCGTRIQKFDKLKNDNNTDFLPEFFRESLRILTDNSHIYCFCSWRTYARFIDSCEAAGLKMIACVVWDKQRDGRGIGDIKGGFYPIHEFCLVASNGRREWDGKRPSDIFRYEPCYDVSHPTEKPVDLIAKIISISSHEGELVCDPFSGSGTTGVAAIQTCRRFLGFEIDPRWCGLANKRIEAAKAQGVLNL